VTTIQVFQVFSRRSVTHHPASVSPIALENSHKQSAATMLELSHLSPAILVSLV